MWLRFEGRNKAKDSRVEIKTTFFSLSLKEFKILETVLTSLLNSSKFEIFSADTEDDIGYGYRSHYDMVVLENDKYKMRVFYHNFFEEPFPPIMRLALKLAFREERDPKVIILQILQIAEGIEVMKKKGEQAEGCVKVEWCIKILRRSKEKC
jgi:hypothetical protein